MCHQLSSSLVKIVNVIVAFVEQSVIDIDAAPYFASAVTFAAIVVIVADALRINY